MNASSSSEGLGLAVVGAVGAGPASEAVTVRVKYVGGGSKIIAESATA